MQIGGKEMAGGDAVWPEGGGGGGELDRVCTLHSARSALPASLAFSKPRVKSLAAMASALASIRRCTFFSISFALSSWLLSLFSANGGAGPFPMFNGSKFLLRGSLSPL